MTILIDGEIVLYGTVGEGLYRDGFTSLSVVQALAELGRGSDVTVRINSPGGYTDEGAAIYNAFKAHRGRVTVFIDAVAASAASLIAMAADDLVMRRGSYMMIHDPAGITIGDAAAHAKTIEGLQAIAGTFADVYAEKSGRSLDEVRADMAAETWLTPDQAVSLGYADRSESTPPADDDAPEPTAFNYRAFQHAPERFVAMADKNGWGKRPTAKAASTAVPPRPQEKPMPTEKQAETKPVAAQDAPDLASARREAATAERSRVSAIMDSDEARGREDLARHFAFATDMEPDAAKAALTKAPQAAAAPVEPKKEPNRFEAAMDRTPNPTVGADGGTSGDGAGDEADPTARILTNYRAATGTKPKAA
ncbi:head maturation protease, ClpP-related [Methylobacterium sp. J-090]|uniref:head maturation protease, ClpP-related n=1 Tax=Methylobacterium sp. J-090 TaxID=2836666 RepID=UPI001FB9B0B2|nr:head maturation protease, ClpP-related [Methylobacterium sp. J-090]MCJ2080741.1 ATP-dependent Clp protease proteolytic subunit [Methylobacterium sp. J-090]